MYIVSAFVFIIIFKILIMHHLCSKVCKLKEIILHCVYYAAWPSPCPPSPSFPPGFISQCAFSPMCRVSIRIFNGWFLPLRHPAHRPSHGDSKSPLHHARAWSRPYARHYPSHAPGPTWTTCRPSVCISWSALKNQTTRVMIACELNQWLQRGGEEAVAMRVDWIVVLIVYFIFVIWKNLLYPNFPNTIFWSFIFLV